MANLQDMKEFVKNTSDEIINKIESGLLIPECCWTCKHCATYRWKVGRRIDEDICMLTGKTILMDDKPYKRRMEWCPLDTKESEE